MLGAAASWTLPVFLEKTFFTLDAMAAESVTQAVTGKDGTILVVLQMAGENDGLNMVVPFADDVYYRSRPRLGIPADKILKLDSYAGLTIPLIASATATLFFRQFFMTIPDELIEASKLDGAGPFRFFFDTLLPLSRTNMAALFVILFILGWNQYLWPLLITTRDDMQTIVIGIKKMIVTSDALTEWQLVMATAMLAMLPPVAVVIAMQRLFVRGLVETEK